MDLRDLKMNVSAMVQTERRRQDSKWGVQRHPHPLWYVILGEEVGEVAEALQRGSVSEKETDAGDLLTELIQVAAVAQAFAEQVYEEMQERK